MSTFDSGAFAELEDIYHRLRLGHRTDYQETWRIFAGNVRYRAELESVAIRLLRRGRLPSQRAADVVHEALLLLARCLERRGDLGFDPRSGEEQFLAWLHFVARSHCKRVLRRQRLKERWGVQLDDEWATVDAPTAPWLAELTDALQSLTASQQAVVAAYTRFGSIEAAAEHVGLSTTTAWRRFRTAVKDIRRHCRPFAGSGRLVGISRALKKW
jgi:DNA-directed RNA polymerase specialized sigma24 family protein